MRLLVFAHTPPPHHGQSVMVQHMLEGFARRPDAYAIQCHHVNARVSTDLVDVGSMRWRKLFLLLGHCARAIWQRWRYRVEAFYYVPAPPKRSALYRDWVVMLLCRPLFRKLILHWHGVGLGAWLETQATPLERWLSHRLLDGADLSIVLSRFSQPDAEMLRPRRTAIVANGIPDPCPGFERELAGQRIARARARQLALSPAPAPPVSPPTELDDAHRVRVLYLAHCTRDKGLFDALEGVRLARERLAAQGSTLDLQLSVAGDFVTAEERAEFEQWLATADRRQWVTHLGFVAGEGKAAAFGAADLFCFPTYYANEGQPVNLIEAMAYGLPAVVTRWRAIPEFLPPNYPGLIEPRQPGQVAAALLSLLGESGLAFRETFLRHFTLDRHLEALARALRETEPR